MADLQKLLGEFAEALEAGRSPDPAEWLGRVDGEERQKLGAMIDRYLMTAPRRTWDPAEYEHSLAKLAVDQVYESLEGASGSWPELLPRLRNRARVKRSELVERLAAALEVGTGQPQLEKVGGYYHRMEHGLLPARGVSARVIEALASIVGEDPDAIRRAGEGAVAGGASESLLFARMAGPPVPAALSDADEAPPEELSDATRAGRVGPPARQRDEIDELFTGG
ncbi:MAG: hypothetical protein ABIZ50_05695 [Solirubrobacterales bacterium]